jgi:hypothetical protein
MGREEITRYDTVAESVDVAASRLAVACRSLAILEVTVLRFEPPATLDEADERMRQAIDDAEAGKGGSAVIGAQSAVVAYVRKANSERLDDAYLRLARMLLESSVVQAVYGDPEVALAAAREGLSWAVTAVNEGGYRPDAAMSRAMVSALNVEVALLQALGRPAETANARNALSALGVTSEPDPLAGLPGLSVTDGGVAGAVRSVRLLGGDDVGLSDLLLAHPVGPLCVPAFRCPPERLRAAAAVSSQNALMLLARNVAAGARLGLEAHFLHAFGLEQQLPVPRELEDQVLVSWCRLLAALAEWFDHAGAHDLSRDLARSGTGVFLLINPELDNPTHIAALGQAIAIFDRFDPEP